MLKGPNQNLLINRICPNPLMFLQGVLLPKQVTPEKDIHLAIVGYSIIFIVNAEKLTSAQWMTSRLCDSHPGC